MPRGMDGETEHKALAYTLVGAKHVQCPQEASEGKVRSRLGPVGSGETVPGGRLAGGRIQR